MKRYDLRHLANDFDKRMNEICDTLQDGEVAIFLFEVRDFTNVQKAIDCILHHERQVFLFRSLFRYKPHETENGILNGLKHKTKHTRFTTV